MSHLIKKIEEYKILFVLFFISLAIRILFSLSLTITDWDAAVYSNLGYDLSRNPFDYSFKNNGWSDYVPSGIDTNFGWPKAGFRAPLLPYFLAIFYFFNLSWLINFFMPIIGGLSVISIFILAEKMFNRNVALFSAIFSAILPINAYYSGKIFTDVFCTFFLILSVLFFWEGFEKGKNKSKILVGIFLGLSVLARYFTILIILAFGLFLIMKNRNFRFLKDRYLLLAIVSFLLVLTPWFIYGLNAYGSPLGPFIHALIAASYWGGVQPWYFYIVNSLSIFSALSILFLASLILILRNRKLQKKSSTRFLLLWFITFFIFFSLAEHKEERFLIPSLPPFIILSSLFLDNLKKFRKFVFSLIILFLIASLLFLFSNVYSDYHQEKTQCFLDSLNFLKKMPDKSVVITQESPIVNYYTRKETHFYSNPFTVNNILNLITSNYKNRTVYFLFPDYGESLDKTNVPPTKDILLPYFNIVFTCPSKGNQITIYEYRGN